MPHTTLRFLSYRLPGKVDQGSDDELCNVVKTPNSYGANRCDNQNNPSVIDHLTARWPAHFFELTSESFKPPCEAVAGLFLFLTHNKVLLLRFGVNRVLAAEPAVFVHFQPIRRVLLVLHAIVVSLLTIFASQGYFHSHLLRHLLVPLPPCEFDSLGTKKPPICRQVELV